LLSAVLMISAGFWGPQHFACEEDMKQDYENSQIIKFNDIPIPYKQIIKRLGYPNSTKITQPVKQILDEFLNQTRDLIEAKGVFRLLKVESQASGNIRFIQSDFKIQSKQVTHMLRKSDIVVLFMVTIGNRLENQVNTLLKEEETTRGFVLDAIGSEMTDAVADEMHYHYLKKLAATQGYSITTRFSPGYGDWTLPVQKDILQLCRGDRIDISLTDSYLMIPRKSVSAVLGWISKI
jgi:cobalamin-dependent methionine synthase I